MHIEDNRININACRSDDYTMTVESKDGHSFDCFVAKKFDIEPRGVVICLGEIFGLTDYLKDVCRRFANENYLAIAPDLYSRLGVSQFSYADKEMAHQAATQQLDQRLAIDDIEATIKEAEKFGNISLVGFSYGATLGWLACSKNPSVQYFAGYYGNRIALYTEVSPQCPYDLFFGSKDVSLSEERKSIIESCIASSNNHFFDVGHGFDCKDRPEDFDQETSEVAFKLVLFNLDQYL